MMKTTWLVWSGMAVSTIAALGVTLACSAEPSDGKPGDSNSSTAAGDSKSDDDSRVPLAVARDRAKVMHDVYAATLDVIHHRYFHGDKAVIPARAMEDIFAEIKRQSQAEARWISVNTQAMSIDHEPKTEFEKRAAREIAEGKEEIDTVEDGYYRRAGAIPLHGGCISCHGGFFRAPSKTKKFAGLVISVLVKSDPRKSE